MTFCKAFNAKTQSMEQGLPTPVVITVFADKSFTFITKTPPAAVLLRKAAGVAKGSGTPNTEKVGKVNRAQLEEIAKTKDPDLSLVVNASREIAKRLRDGQLVVLESTTYPGTTEELILPSLRESGLEVGKGFFLAFSPERVDPGNTRWNTRNTPKIIGGMTPSFL